VSRLRADLLVAASVPLLLAAGLLAWQRDEMCTVAGCGTVEVNAWDGSPGWALPVLAGIAVGGLWVLLLPARPAPTWLAALTAAVGGLGAVVLVATLDAVVFGRAGFFRFELPVVEEFPVLSVSPGPGLPLGLLALLLQAAAGWMTVRARGALVSPWRPPRRTDRVGRADRAARRRRAGYPAGTAVGLAQGPSAPRRAGAGPRHADTGPLPHTAPPGPRHADTGPLPHTAPPGSAPAPPPRRGRHARPARRGR